MKKRIGFIAGVFDGPINNCPHDGHKFLLRKAWESCDYLVVAVNSDNYIRSRKGREPLTAQHKRIENLYATNYVSECVPFESSPIDIIKFLKPDFIYCGSDYRPEQVVGYEEAEEWGGKVVIIDRIPGISTTGLLKEAENEETVACFTGKLMLKQRQ